VAAAPVGTRLAYLLSNSRTYQVIKTRQIPQSKTPHDRKTDPPTRACPRILRPGNPQEYRESAMVGWRPLLLDR